jgi:predicted transposase YbfD/YdcC
LPKKTTAIIINTNNHYLIGVKKNQKSLYTQIEALTANMQTVDSRFVELLKTKGRTERREVWVCAATSDFNKGWIGLKQVIKVQRRVKDKGKIRQEDAFYISSLDVNALVFCWGIKSHWSIENNLHWVKDITFGEDASRIRTANAPQNTSVFRNISINLFRTNDYQNLAQAQRLVSNDIDKLKQLIN